MKARVWLPFVTALVLVPVDGVPAGSGAPRLLADFDEEGPGVPFGEAFARAPSTANARRTPEVRGHALEISGRHVRGGVAGVRVTFYDPTAKKPDYPDATRYFYITFQIRGTGYPSRLQAKLTDAAGAPRDEGVDTGEVTRYLPQGVTTDWQTVAIPLGSHGMNRKGLATLILEVVDPSDFTFFIDDIALKRDLDDALPPPKPRRGVPSK